MTPSVVICPMLPLPPLPAGAMNQRAPSGPWGISENSSFLLLGRANSVIVAVGVIRPIFSFPGSVKQELWCRPGVSPGGRRAAVGSGNSVMPPVGVILPIRLPVISVNQRFPSGPGVITVGLEDWVGIGKGLLNVGTARTRGTISRARTNVTASATTARF